jgi:hypothetical protein
MKPAGHGGPAYGVQMASPFSQAYGEQKPSMQGDQGYVMEPPSDGSHTYGEEAFNQDSEETNYGGEQVNYGGEQTNYGGEQANYGEGTTYGGGLPVHADDSAYQGEQASDTKITPKFSFFLKHKLLVNKADSSFAWG